jgi:hypothetical protein
MEPRRRNTWLSGRLARWLTGRCPTHAEDEAKSLPVPESPIKARRPPRLVSRIACRGGGWLAGIEEKPQSRADVLLASKLGIPVWVAARRRRRCEGYHRFDLVCELRRRQHPPVAHCLSFSSQTRLALDGRSNGGFGRTTQLLRSDRRVIPRPQPAAPRKPDSIGIWGRQGPGTARSAHARGKGERGVGPRARNAGACCRGGDRTGWLGFFSEKVVGK